MPRLTRTTIAIGILIFFAGLSTLLPHLRSSSSRNSSPSFTRTTDSLLASRQKRIKPDEEEYHLPPSIHLGTDLNTHGLWTISPSEISKLKQHPITTLISEARLKASSIEAKIERIQSLEQAITDYEQSFGLPPPLGFEQWFVFASIHDSITVPSLIPQAHKSVLPFLSYPAGVLRERVEALVGETAKNGGDRGMWYFEIVYGKEAEGLEWSKEGKDGWVGIKKGGGASEGGRARDMAKLYLDILPYIPPPPPGTPPLRLLFGMHDGPTYQTHSSILSKSTRLAKAGKLWDEVELKEKEEEMRGLAGWRWTCEGGSGLRVGGMDVDLGEVGSGRVGSASYGGIGGKGKSFVADEHKTWNFCENPGLMDLHGTLLNDDSRHTKPMVPMIATCKTMTNVDVLSTPLEATGQTQALIPWSSKTESRLFWRGKLTGAFHNKQTRWRLSQRERAHFLVERKEGEVDILLEKKGKKGEVLGLEVKKFDLGELNERYMNVAPVDGPVQCDPGECEKVKEAIKFGARVPSHEQIKYKYILDVDGNAWSSRFRRLLTGTSVILKSTIFPEWNSDLLVPWYHYVPIQMDYSDVYDIMLYFVGQEDQPDSGHDAEAEEIAMNARKFAENRWAYDDMQSYMLLMTLEYQRAMSDDRAAATYLGDIDDMDDVRGLY